MCVFWLENLNKFLLEYIFANISKSIYVCFHKNRFHLEKLPPFHVHPLFYKFPLLGSEYNTMGSLVDSIIIIIIMIIKAPEMGLPDRRGNRGPQSPVPTCRVKGMPNSKVQLRINQPPTQGNALKLLRQKKNPYLSDF